MKILKLGLISVVAFYLLFWLFTLLFPGTTVLSRAANMSVGADTLMQMLKNNYISVAGLLAGDKAGSIDVRASDIAFYDDNLFNMQGQGQVSDTLFIQVSSKQKVVVQGGLALYPMGKDSSTAQLYYVFKTPWYKPWEKMFMMMADKKYGAQMEEVLERLRVEAKLP